MGRAFHNRKDAMAKTAAQKTKLYSKYGRALYVCAKQGAPDPAMNPTLKAMIDKAKREQVPAHVIDKAIDKAKGAGGEDFAHARYEGYGPGGAMLIVECLTDNSTRTFNEVRACFNKNGGKLGNSGAVAHMFDHLAILSFKGDDPDGVLEALLGADVDVTDVEHEDGMVNVFTPNTEYGAAKKALLEAVGEVEFAVDEIRFLPQAAQNLEGDDRETFDRLVELLEELDDVQQVFHSVD